MTDIRTVARRDKAPAGEGTALAVEMSPDGFVFNVHDAECGVDHPSFTQKEVRLPLDEAVAIVEYMTEYLREQGVM
ncbi:hypothetical protein SEA_SETTECANDELA_203 [Mycobacterium phage Settecandela]|nr:hypothetical protein SEA_SETTECANDELA_203 [Mycobacterium phage Settecandela]